MAKSKLEPIEEAFKQLTGKSPAYSEDKNSFYMKAQPMLSGGEAWLTVQKEIFTYRLEVVSDDVYLSIRKEKGEELSDTEKRALDALKK